MGNELELHQVIYHILRTQIRFGVYRYRESLPTMEEASEQFLVSVGPVRSAYRRLKEEGYITLSKNVGAVVKVRYSRQEMEENIQAFFGPRRRALTDLCAAMPLLFGQIQWLGMRYAPPDTLRDMELLLERDLLASYALFQNLEQRYGALGNDLLLRLFWQLYMFFETPFFSIPENVISNYLPEVLQFCLEQDWAGLRRWIAGLYDTLSDKVNRFYGERITAAPSGGEIPFVCSFYQKPVQICYSLATELLSDISYRNHPPGSLLPTIEELARDKGVSVSTVRRTYALLSKSGAVKSTPRVGTWALSHDESAEHCDYTDPAARKRIVDYAQSLQLLTLSCGAVSEWTLGGLDPERRDLWKQQLLELKRTGRPDLLLPATFGFLYRHAPNETVRTVYRGLAQQLIWGYPLYSVHRAENIFESLHRPCLESLLTCLERQDAHGFAAALEGMMLDELRFTLRQLSALGVHETERILVPRPGESVYAPSGGEPEAN